LLPAYAAGSTPVNAWRLHAFLSATFIAAVDNHPQVEEQEGQLMRQELEKVRSSAFPRRLLFG